MNVTLKKLIITGLIALVILLVLPFVERLLPGLTFSLLTLCYPLVILYFIKQNNHGKKYFELLAASIVALYLLLLFVPELLLPRLIVLAILTVIYFLRVLAKENKRGVDFLKATFFFTYCAILTYQPMLQYDFEYGREYLLESFHQICFGIGFLLLIIDKMRSIESLKSKFKVFFIFLSACQIVVTMGFFVYAVIQKMESEKQRGLAIMEKEYAEAERRKAEKEREKAEVSKMYAEQVKRKAEEDQKVLQTKVKELEDSLKVLKKAK